MSGRSAVWHPNTQMAEWDGFRRIVSADGMWLTDSGGNRMIDAVASMWCNVWGHSHPRLLGAMSDQSGMIQHVPLFNLTHEPAERLAGSLVGMSPGMHRVFYSDNGSSAIEIAIKMAIQYWKNTGDDRRGEIASLRNGYHGDTLGAMSVGYVPEFFGAFREHLLQTVRFDAPGGCGTGGHAESDDQERCLDVMERRFADGDDIAALVMESGAQVAGGVRIYPHGFQRRVGALCRKYGVLLILDEIATGLGRLGSMVEYQRQQSTPDIVTYGKMLTGGYLTLAATLASRGVYESFLGGFADGRHLFHGHTYTGNPIAAAVANENLLMYEENRLIEQVRDTSGIFDEYLDELNGMDHVGGIRHEGMLMGIDLVNADGTPVSPEGSVNRIVFEEGARNGIYLRTLGNIVMLVPPLAISGDELHMLMERAVDTIRNVRDMIL